MDRMIDPQQIVRASKRILLVDWPNVGVPIALIEAGFTVFGSSPAGYSEIQLVSSADGSAPELTFHRRKGPPDSVHLVCVYRPAEELAEIVKRQVVPLGARALWIQAPNRADNAAVLAEKNGLSFVNCVDIAALAKEPGARDL